MDAQDAQMNTIFATKNTEGLRVYNGIQLILHILCIDVNLRHP